LQAERRNADENGDGDDNSDIDGFEVAYAMPPIGCPGLDAITPAGSIKAPYPDHRAIGWRVPDAPARAIAAAEAEGAVLSLDATGTSIVAPASQAISAATLELLRESKAAVIAILAARAAAIAPRVLV
jgi:hypothetical protein